MNYEEKLVRYIASKLIQKHYFMKNGEFPNEKKLAKFINIVLNDLIQKHKQLKLIRTHSKEGLITPDILESVRKLNLK